MDKSGLLNATLVPLDIFVGILVISGGIAIALSYVNLGSLMASLGLLIELVKAIVKGGLK